jgi:hypothetical protein
VLNVLARPYDPREPVIAFDERPVALRGASRPGRPMRAGRIAREDYEYVRRTANVYCIVEPKAWRPQHPCDPRPKDAALAAIGRRRRFI